MMLKDRSLLEDMRENASIAMDMSVGLDAEILRSAIPALYSTLHAIQIVGEAASKVSMETRATIPGIPWNEVIATRHVITHGYRAVDTRIIIEIVQNHLPSLVEQISRFLEEKHS